MLYECMSEWTSKFQHPTRHIIQDESSETINCTGTDNTIMQRKYAKTHKSTSTCKTQKPTLVKKTCKQTYRKANAKHKSKPTGCSSL